MSTKPYAMHGGVRIRQQYNRALLRYMARVKDQGPVGASGTEWSLWLDWKQDWRDRLRETRDTLIAAATLREKEKANAIKRQRGNCRGT